MLQRTVLHCTVLYRVCGTLAAPCLQHRTSRRDDAGVLGHASQDGEGHWLVGLQCCAQSCSSSSSSSCGRKSRGVSSEATLHDSLSVAIAASAQNTACCNVGTCATPAQAVLCVENNQLERFSCQWSKEVPMTGMCQDACAAHASAWSPGSMRDPLWCPDGVRGR